MKRNATIAIFSVFLFVIFAGCADDRGQLPEEKLQEEGQEEMPGNQKEESPEESPILSEEELFAERGKKPADGYNILQDIDLITNQFIKGSAGFDEIDHTDACGSFGSVAIPREEGALVLRDWNTTDLSAYLENGELIFWVKGEKGGENFLIEVQDCDRDRPGENDSVFICKNISEYREVTADWQEVRIPLKDYFDGKNGLDITCVWTIRLKNARGNVKVSNMKIVSPDKEPAAAAIKLNQLGFRTDAEKYALVSGFYEQLTCSTKTSFQLIDAKNGESVYQGNLILVDGYDAKYSGETIYKADFSDFSREGTYYISVNDPNTEDSCQFQIGGEIYHGLLGTVSKYYYFQRANVALTQEYAGKWQRDALYLQDFQLGYLSDGTKTKDVSGGWFDAGDFGKYVDPGVGAVTDLLWAYISFPEVFPDGLADIPESGNGIPDLLDEIKVELDFFLKMQDTDGGIYHRVHPDDGSRAIVDTFANGDGGNVKSTGTTAHAAGALALASTVYQEFDAGYADTLRKAAQNAWDYVLKHPGIGSSGAYSTPETEHQTFFAACGLYYATGNDTYHQYIKEHYNEFGAAYKTDTFGHYHSDMRKMAYISYLASEHREEKIVKWIGNLFDHWKKEVLTIASNPWNTPLPVRALSWGSNANALDTGMEMYLTQKYLGMNPSDGETLICNMVNFILGTNPSGKSIVTGIGENCIKRTYSGIFGTDEIEEFPPGYTSGGVNMYDAAIVSRFPLKRYSDTALDWVSNENSIFYQSPFLFGVAMQAAME